MVSQLGALQTLDAPVHDAPVLMISYETSALLMIDMQNGFIDPSSSLCVAGARATIPACAHALATARGHGMAIYHVRRAYAFDGSDVEPVRRRIWLAGGRPLCREGSDPRSIEAPDKLAPHEGECIVCKPRFSAFFDTQLDAMLRDRDIDTVVLAGTTTPNCIRTTCYDALSLGYNVVVLEDATSSRTPAVQKANIDDMAYIGTTIMSCDEFAAGALLQVEDLTD